MKTKRFLSILLSLVLVLGMLPSMSLTASAENNTTTITPGTDDAKTGTGTMTITLVIPEPVTGVSLDKTTAQTINVNGIVSFTATIDPSTATDKTVVWSIGGADAGAVKLYTDEACTTEVGADATDKLTVYAKGISAGSATVTATSNTDSSKSASCDVTVNTAAAAAQYKVIGTAINPPSSMPSDFMEVTEEEAWAYGHSFTGTVCWLVIYAKDGNNYKFVRKAEWGENKGTNTWENIIYGESGCYPDPSQVSLIIPYGTPHTHSFTYSASGDTITATCGADGCTLPPSTEGGTDHVATLTIVAPTLTTYGGTGEAAATLTGLDAFNTATGKTIAATEIKYVGRDSTTYAESATAPTNAGEYTAKITVEEKTASVDYEITKADPTATAPTATATYGQTLADVTLTNPDGNTAGEWAWVDAGTTSVGTVGDHSFKANFTPTDTTNYNSKSNVDVTVTVGKAANPATVTGTASVTKGGNTVDLANNVTFNGATGAVSYEISGEANGCSLNGSVLTSGDNTGSVTVNVTVAEDDNYNALAATSITVTISDKGTQTITASDVTATYGDTDKKVSATTDGNGAISYAVKDGSADYIDVDASTGALMIKKVGTATVIVTAAETATYAQATKEVTVTINKANAVAATVTANNRTYDGTEKPLVTVTGEPTGGTMQYALGENAATAPADNLYTTSIPTATNAGTYYVWYRVEGDGNHFDTNPQCVTVTISRRPSSGGSGHATAPTTTEVAMLRVYNPWSGEHLYTDSMGEVHALEALGWAYEGVAWVAPASSATPVWRLYNPYSGDHHYTTGRGEYDELVDGGWTGEGIGFYSDDAKTVAVWRLFNPFVEVGTHHYTTGRAEYDGLPASGWVQEGVGWYALR